MTTTTMLENYYVLEISITVLSESKGSQFLMQRVKSLDSVFNKPNQNGGASEISI